eukprot:2757112-Lingulodinium_polyedra.AAC.1
MQPYRNVKLKMPTCPGGGSHCSPNLELVSKRGQGTRAGARGRRCAGTGAETQRHRSTDRDAATQRHRDTETHRDRDAGTQ